MPVKASKCQNNIRDRILFSDVVTLANTSGSVYVFFDEGTNHNWQVVAWRWLSITNYIINQATNVSLGIAGTVNYFAPSQSLGTAAINAGTKTAALTLSTTNSVLTSGTVLTASWTQNASQSGTGKFYIRLRPQDVKWQGVKRPMAAQKPQ